MTGIHTPEIRMFPLRCNTRGCQEFKKTVYLPFSEKGGRWMKLEEASEKCIRCEQMYSLLQVQHLVIPDENGQIYGSLETSPGLFSEHPIKRWEFVCDNAKRGFSEQKESIDYPHVFTTVPSVANCYDCLEVFSKLEEEEQNKLMAYFQTKE